MTIPVAVWCPDEFRDRTHRFIPLDDARVRVEGSPGLTDSQSLRQRVRSRADWNRRLIGCNDAYGGRGLHRPASLDSMREVETVQPLAPRPRYGRTSHVTRDTTTD